MKPDYNLSSLLENALARIAAERRALRGADRHADQDRRAWRFLFDITLPDIANFT